MSLPENALFDKVASVNIRGKLFQYPPFSIEFTQMLKIDKMTTNKIRLYNPAPDTIKLAVSKKKGKTRLYPQIIVDAGYINDYGTAIRGEILDYSVGSKGQDTILEMSVSDITSKWANALINESWKNTKISTIISEMLATVGLVGEVTLGKDKRKRSFTATTFRESIKKLAKASQSKLYFKNGVFKIEPDTPDKNRTVLFISPQTGLLSDIKKTAAGFKIKTLFFHSLQMGDIIQIKDKNTPTSTVRIVKGKKVFSTFKKSFCEFEVTET